MPMFRVVDLRPSTENEMHIEARSPEKAAMRALHMDLTRSGSAKNLVCRVYWRDGDSSVTNMIRLYARAMQPPRMASC